MKGLNAWLFSLCWMTLPTKVQPFGHGLSLSPSDVLVNESDAPMVNTFRMAPFSLDLEHKPLYLHIATKNSHIDQCIMVQKEMMNIIWPTIKKLIYMEMRLIVMTWTSLLINIWKQIRSNWRMSRSQDRVSVYQHTCKWMLNA